MNYLLQISVGPVQDFIAAARRTRDLWFGSMMLSEIAKAVALDVKNNGGKLIFPAPSSDDDLLPESDLSVANVILAEFNGFDSEQLRKFSDSANNAAKARLKVYADKVFEKMKLNIVEDRWNMQIDDIIEFYSAWVPVDNDYHLARQNVARLLAARKNIRDFNANKCLDKVPKSSLDGLRESVLIGKLPDELRIKSSEALDAIGLIKRVPIFSSEAEKNRNAFYSITRVALSSWTHGKGKRFVSDPGFREKYDELLRADEFDRETIAWYLGQSFMEKYLPEAPYIAFICADGDRMGAALSSMNMNSADEHRNFSQQLSKFALAARNDVKANNGVCVYTGGDDVMAFMPVDKALSCARALHDSFAEIMKDFPGTSLSVGVSIAHAMENLGMLLDYAREAEGIAKKGIKGLALKLNKDRNGLAISVRSRGNIPFVVREQWNNNKGSGLSAMSLDERVSWFAERFMNNEIPAKFPYELRENAKFYEEWTDFDLLKKATISDVTRIFSNKDITVTNDEKNLIGEYIKAKVYNAGTIREFADELILAQWIGSSMKEGEASELQNNPD